MDVCLFKTFLFSFTFETDSQILIGDMSSFQEHYGFFRRSWAGRARHPEWAKQGMVCLDAFIKISFPLRRNASELYHIFPAHVLWTLTAFASTRRVWFRIGNSELVISLHLSSIRNFSVSFCKSLRKSRNDRKSKNINLMALILHPFNSLIKQYCWNYCTILRV